MLAPPAVSDAPDRASKKKADSAAGGKGEARVRQRQDLAQLKSAADLSFEELDADGDGLLTEADMLPCAHLIRFDLADVNRDGVVDRREFKLARSFAMDREAERCRDGGAGELSVALRGRDLRAKQEIRRLQREERRAEHDGSADETRDLRRKIQRRKMQRDDDARGFSL